MVRSGFSLAVKGEPQEGLYSARTCSDPCSTQNELEGERLGEGEQVGSGFYSPDWRGRRTPPGKFWWAGDKAARLCISVKEAEGSRYPRGMSMTLVLNVLPKKSLWDTQGEKSGRKLEMVI